MKQTIIAIDPGTGGGFAIKHELQKPYAMKMPDTEGDIVELFAEQMLMAESEDRERIAVIEQVGTFAGNVNRGNSQAVLYGSYKFMVGALQATHWRIELVRPQKWQPCFGLGKRRDCVSDTEWKNKLKEKAQQLFPELKVTLSTADALLLLEYWLKVGSAQPAAPIGEESEGET